MAYTVQVLRDLQDLPRDIVGSIWAWLGRLLERWANDDIGRR